MLYDPQHHLTPSQRSLHVQHRERLARIARGKAPSVPQPSRVLLPVPFCDLTDPVSIYLDRQRRRAETLEAIKEFTNQYESKIPSLMLILRAVCEFYGVSHLSIRSSRRTANIVRPRQVFFYLARELTTRSLPQIGRFIGGRDHTTALHATRKIAGLLETDGALAEAVNQIRAEISIMNCAIRG